MELNFSAILGLVQLVGTIFVFMVIKFNDLRHLHMDVKTLIQRQENIENKVNTLTIDLAYIKGHFDLEK